MRSGPACAHQPLLGKSSLAVVKPGSADAPDCPGVASIDADSRLLWDVSSGTLTRITTKGPLPDSASSARHVH